ncbi:amidase domain-containing protein [Clostridium cochlearium]|uniref:Amidase domain-containing protein n=1 Tax=Clostridium cochlearium TaxID=1494 RepID=A0A1G9I9S6_CLOCO|nr:amidase domain-containing protein [Clostridium cochlearium]MBE6064382.1 hypothetical protein [Clostridium cochlearium]MBU5268828.1 amidase domain-containing protein [Clostridium cochlearium]MCR1970603.1 amidase domain-containing protein [Clostridium cochlearium]NMA57315.1 amidase domain-containing protein [Clostridium cochlearium]SDL21856.1 Putative amidase domain-containing protein [Clostridium cochlearium]
MKKSLKCTSYTLVIIFFASFLIFKTYDTNLSFTNSFFSSNALSEEIDKDELKEVIETIYNDRCKVFINGDLESLPKYYDTSRKYGKWSLDQEVRRVKYLRTWAYQRDIEFTNINSKIILKRVSSNKSNIRLGLKEIYTFEYIYKNDENATKNKFGTGIDHTVNLINKNNQWIIANDWYTDCFHDALKAYSGEIREIDLSKVETLDIPKIEKDMNFNYSGKYNRIKAVEYANRYCGAFIEDENTDYKYNKKYKNYSGIGGDCTNFASQVLADKEAGEIPMDYTWFSHFSKKEGIHVGSKAWVNADTFKNYILYSGKGQLIKKGTFKQLALSTDNYLNGACEKLELGDLICYVKGGKTDHFAIVTGFDSRGYPLVNSHTTDRYNVPWDLGWGDKDISFYLIHIRK